MGGAPEQERPEGVERGDEAAGRVDEVLEEGGGEGGRVGGGGGPRRAVVPPDLPELLLQGRLGEGGEAARGRGERDGEGEGEGQARLAEVVRVADDGDGGGDVGDVKGREEEGLGLWGVVAPACLGGLCGARAGEVEGGFEQRERAGQRGAVHLWCCVCEK